MTPGDAKPVQVVLTDFGGWIDGSCESVCGWCGQPKPDDGDDWCGQCEARDGAQALAALRSLAAGEPLARVPLARVPAPGDVPAGMIVVHNAAQPGARIGRKGFRAWLADPSPGFEPCDCGWARRLGQHYRAGGAS
jgi:hypothetical protein